MLVLSHYATVRGDAEAAGSRNGAVIKNWMSRKLGLVLWPSWLADSTSQKFKAPCQPRSLFQYSPVSSHQTDKWQFGCTFVGHFAMYVVVHMIVDQGINLETCNISQILNILEWFYTFRWFCYFKTHYTNIDYFILDIVGYFNYYCLTQSLLSDIEIFRFKPFNLYLSMYMYLIFE